MTFKVPLNSASRTSLLGSSHLRRCSHKLHRRHSKSTSASMGHPTLPRQSKQVSTTQSSSTSTTCIPGSPTASTAAWRKLCTNSVQRQTHSVVESAFAPPSLPLSNGFYSGFIESYLDCGAAPQHFILTVKDTNLHWFYCSQKGYCADRMVGVINP